MDLEEPNQMDKGQIIEDMDAVAPRPAPAAEIVQIATVWATEMAAQPDGFMIGEEELAEAILEAEALTAVVKMAEDDPNEDDEDIDDDDDMMDDDEDIAADLPVEMTFGLDDDIPPYESD